MSLGADRATSVGLQDGLTEQIDIFNQFSLDKYLVTLASRIKPKVASSIYMSILPFWPLNCTK